MGNDDYETITINGETVYSVNPEPDYTVSYTTSPIDISTISSTTLDSSSVVVNSMSDDFTYSFGDSLTVFEDTMPDLVIVEDMAVEYPTLKIAFEKFKSVYKMVEQDYKGKKVDD